MDSEEEFNRPTRFSQSIVLLGIKHVGKTTIGRLFATRNHLEWLDLDEVILDTARKSHDLDAQTIRDVYIGLGKEGFQEIETVAARHVRLHASQNHIISTGGGIADNPGALREIQGVGLLVYLQEQEATLFKRVMSKGIPPFLDPADPARSFKELYARRDSIYRSTAQLIVALQGASISQGIELFEKNLLAAMT